MSNIFESSELFEASIRFENAATSLAQIVDNRELCESGQNSLRWAGQLLRTVDWESEKDSSKHITPEVAVRATSIRPFFYNVLIESRNEFIDAGIKSEQDAITFFKNFYGLLDGDKNSKELEPAHLRLASRFLHEISRGLLLEVTGNSYPDSDEHSEFAMATH